MIQLVGATIAHQTLKTCLEKSEEDTTGSAGDRWFKRIIIVDFIKGSSL